MIINFFLSKLKNKFLHRKKFRDLSLARKESGPRIHIGCGPIDLPGWINVDARGFSHVHIVTDSIDLKEFLDGTVQEIYLCHVLEHFSFDNVDSLLKIYHSKLVPDGILRLSVPDFELLIRIYQETNQELELIRSSLMGGQHYPENYHKSIYDRKLLTKLLLKAGFSDIIDWVTKIDFGKDIGDWSNGKLNLGFKIFDISLNLKAMK